MYISVIIITIIIISSSSIIDVGLTYSYTQFLGWFSFSSPVTALVWWAENTQPDWVMAQFGGQKNPPWATQFAATAVSQPGHSGQSLDLNSLHCEYNTLESMESFMSSIALW